MRPGRGDQRAARAGELLVAPRPHLVLDLGLELRYGTGAALHPFADPRSVWQWAEELPAVRGWLLEDHDPRPAVRKVDARSRTSGPHTGISTPCRGQTRTRAVASSPRTRAPRPARSPRPDPAAS